MRILGIDPGAHGAIALLVDGKLTEVADMPTTTYKGKARIDAAALAVLIRRLAPTEAWLERVAAMPGQGVSSMFAFGMAYGAVLGVLGALAVPVNMAAPAQWKAALRVPRDKGAARGRASELVPDGVRFWPLAKHDGRAEAALIACYGFRQGNGAVRPVEW
jgi:crossover junction endodeoxyribonuclease RuvC